LSQGDLLIDFPIVVPAGTLDQILSDEGTPASVLTGNVIILSQSCDLDKGKTGNVLLAPFYDADYFVAEFLDGKTDKARTGYKKQIKAGRFVSLYLLPPCPVEQFEASCRVVNFRDVAIMPLPIVQEHAEKRGDRVCLQPPYREDLAQAFARFVMRVGHPQEYDLE
jgi:hypothetical protein